MDENVRFVEKLESDLEKSRIPQTLRWDQGEAVPVVVILLCLEEGGAAEFVIGIELENILPVNETLGIDLDGAHNLINLKRKA